MVILTRKETGLFPSPAEIEMKCSCPDWAGMCKHIAAVLYGVGARLDHSPELLFMLRSVNHEELIQQAAAATDLTAKATGAPELSESEIGAVFGIELDTQTAPTPAAGQNLEQARPTKAKTPVRKRRAKASPAAIKAQAPGAKRTGRKGPRPG